MTASLLLLYCGGNDKRNYGGEFWAQIDYTACVYVSLYDTYEYIDIRPDRFIIIFREPHILVFSLSLSLSLLLRLHIKHKEPKTCSTFLVSFCPFSA